VNYEDLKVWSWARAADEQKQYRIEPKKCQKAVSVSQLAGNRSLRGPHLAQHPGTAQAIIWP